MKKITFLCTFVATGALLTLSAFANPSLESPSVVTPADTFNIAVGGFNSTSGSGEFLTSQLTATFTGTGVAQTFTSAAFNNQTVSVFTTQTIGATTTTDSISLSVPTNFIPAGTTAPDGSVINDIELDMGELNAGTNTLDFATAITSTPTYTGSILYSGGTLTFSPTPTLTNGNASLAYFEGINTTATAGLSQFAITRFNFSITYANVPEPSTWALSILGLAGCAGVVLRRRRAQA